MSRSSKLWKEAATAILIQRGVRLGDTQNYGIKLLMLERSSRSKFMPSVCVFPGGVVSKDDFSCEWMDLLNAWNQKNQNNSVFRSSEYGIHSVIQSANERPPMIQANSFPHSSLSSNIAYRLCALRETFEECGVLLHKSLNDTTPHIDSSCLKEWRDKVNKDSSEFLKMCKEFDIIPDLCSLFEWTNWLTPTHMSDRRYDTMFYAACVEHAIEAEHDQKEIVASKWYSPEEMLNSYYREEMLLAPPQIYEVCRFLHPHLQQWADVKEHIRNRAEAGCERWLPVRINCTDGVVSVLPGDELYPEDPDIEGTEPILETKDSVKQSRHKCDRLHRMEIKGAHDCKVACTIQPNFGHVPPLEWISIGTN